MKEAKVYSLGFEMTKQVPDSVTEFDQLAKQEGACLNEAINSTLYRGTYAEFRDLFLHGRDADGDTPAFEGIEQLTGIKRLTKTIKNAKGEESEAWDESEAVYWKRVVQAKFGGDAEAAVAHFQSVAQAAMGLSAFDPSIRERKSAGPKTIAKTYKTIAEQAVKDGKAQRLADALGAKLGRAVSLVDGDDAKNVDILARAIADNEAKKRAELKNEYAV